RIRFWTVLGISQLLCGLALVFILVLLIHFGKGFGWRNDPRQFSFHPFFMILGFIIFYTQASLVYRTFPHVAKPKLKLIHLTLQVLSLIFIVIGLVSVFDAYGMYPKMTSLHSWVGMGTVVLFCCQLLFGFLTFLIPRTPQSIRTHYLPIHTFFGSAIFLMAVASCLLGFMRFVEFNKSTYSNFSPGGVLVNCLGLVLILLAMCVTYLLVSNEYKRQPRAEDQQRIVVNIT
uniref:Cytochrome b561 domain-containing protein n=1 Tax=Strigamia maritima TaxID=126957 RepID=T1JIN6_STRMM